MALLLLTSFVLCVVSVYSAYPSIYDIEQSCGCETSYKDLIITNVGNAFDAHITATIQSIQNAVDPLVDFEVRSRLDALTNALKDETTPAVDDASATALAPCPQNISCASIPPGAPTGEYLLYVDSKYPGEQAWCDMDNAGGNWTVIVNHVNNSVNFNRQWADYKAGFGNLGGNFWWGLKNVHSLVKNKQFKLRVDMKDFSDVETYAVYTNFTLGDEASFYKITVNGYDSGNSNAGDHLSYHDGMGFTTTDQDHDQSAANCASTNEGAFWFKDCDTANFFAPIVQSTKDAATEWGSDSVGMKEMKVMVKQ